MRLISADEGQAGTGRDSHNDHTVKIAIIGFEPAEFKMMREIYLTIVTHLDNL
jgi:hypothetical protein